MIAQDRDLLDERLKELEPSLSNYADFLTRRAREYAVVISEYFAELIEADDDWVKDSNFTSPLATGTETVNTTISDIFEIALPGTEVKIAGDTIWLQQGTGVMVAVPRTTLFDFELGTSTLGFQEVHNKVLLYAKQGEFTAPGNLCYLFYRWLDHEPATGGTVLDIKPQDFESIAERVSERMVSST